MWEQTESGRVKTQFEPAVLAATLAMIPVLIIQADAKSDGWQTFAQVANLGDLERVRGRARIHPRRGATEPSRTPRALARRRHRRRDHPRLRQIALVVATCPA